MDDVFPVYQALWRRAHGEGAYVRYDGFAANGEAGWFHPTHYPKPTIVVVRPYYKEPAHEPSRDSNAPPHQPQPDILEELITLAHEYGHFKSSDGRTERAEYDLYKTIAMRRDAIMKEETARMPEGLTNEQHNDRLRTGLYAALGNDARSRILREESLAWKIGREVLAELGVNNFNVYDDRTKKGLHRHRYRLGTDDLWPDDV